MNSINYKRSTELSTAISQDSFLEETPALERDTAADGFSAMAQMRSGPKSKISRKQRVAGIAGAFVLQTGLAIALIYGTEIKSVLKPPPLTMVAIVQENKLEETPPPPPPPRLIAPDLHVVTLPPMPDIALPPPPTPLPPSPTAITTSATQEPVTPPVAVVESYQVRLLRYLAGYRRYPAIARNKHQEGVVFVRFAMDRRGNVLSSVIEKRSRFEALNDEALTVFKRANPLPAPPPEMAGDPLLLVMPVEFSLR